MTLAAHEVPSNVTVLLDTESEEVIVATPAALRWIREHEGHHPGAPFTRGHRSDDASLDLQIRPLLKHQRLQVDSVNTLAATPS